MGGDQPVGQGHDVGEFVGGGEGLDVAGPVEQLVFEGQITEQRFLERLSLFDHRLDRGARAAEERADQRWHATEFAHGGLDGLGAGAGIVGVLGQFAMHRLGAGLREPGFGDLDFGVGQVEDSAKLRQKSCGVAHAGLVPFGISGMGRRDAAPLPGLPRSAEQ